MKITALDHLVLTVTDIERSIDFYRRILGMEVLTFAEGRQALRFGRQKINLHPAEGGIEPVANRPTPGSADLCLLLDATLEDALAELAQKGVAVEAGPVKRSGATGALNSIYLRDPDGNLIELSTREEDYLSL
jgi:catechol 2,3-dioxygenase-like lactoylglutathione lyase family enzyme